MQALLRACNLRDAFGVSLRKVGACSWLTGMLEVVLGVLTI